jgi:alpha-L-fucosidase 2
MDESNLSRRAVLRSAATGLAALALPSDAQTEPPVDDLRLWYRRPAATWEEALPIGNGRLGGMVYGQIGTDRVQLNEETVWAGEKLDRLNPRSAHSLTVVRKLLLAGKIKEAEELAENDVIAVPKHLAPYQPVGDLVLHFAGQEPAAEYRRELGLDSAIVRVTYRSRDAHFTREYLASAVDQVIAIRLACDKPGRISFTATLTRESDSRTQALEGGRVVIIGEAIARSERLATQRKVGVKFYGALQVLPDGGRVEIEGDQVHVEEADSATLLFAATTNFRDRDPAWNCEQCLAAARKPFAQLRADHIADYRRFFRRVEFRLGAPKSDLPTDERLKRVEAGQTDPGLQVLHFQYGRYLLISCSRPGTMAANLRGIWNPDLLPPWDSKYMTNINLEVAYWPAEVAGLSELHEPLFDLIDNTRVDGHRVAKDLYGAPGFVIHHATDIWGSAVPIDGVHAGLWPLGAVWMSLHLWEHYDYTRDRSFLAQRAYPTMKQAGEFLLANLVDDGHGHLVTGPSISPENAYLLPDGAVHKLCMGPTSDIEMTRALFGHLIEASRLLGVDVEFRSRLVAAIELLPPLKIGKYGQLQEWQEDYEEAEPGHRHMSHLFAMYPADQVTLRGTPELARAVRVSIERRLRGGGAHTGWSRAWVVLLYARLEDAERAQENLLLLLAKNTQPDLLALRPPFLIDGNLGATAAIAEMLLQSHAGEISLLPALPKAWPEGSIKGLCARGGVRIDIRWAPGQGTIVLLRPKFAGEHRVRPPRGQRIEAVFENGKALPLERSGGGLLFLKVQASAEYRIDCR